LAGALVSVSETPTTIVSSPRALAGAKPSLAESY